MKRRERPTDLLSVAGSQPALFDVSAISKAQPRRRRPGTAKRPDPLETDIIRMILEGLRRHPAVCRIERSNTGAGRLMQNGKPGRFVRFGFVGQPDITGMSRDGRVIAIEVKRRTTRKNVSEAQMAYLEAVIQAGGLAGVATNVEEAFAIVEGRS